MPIGALTSQQCMDSDADSGGHNIAAKTAASGLAWGALFGGDGALAG